MFVECLGVEVNVVIPGAQIGVDELQGEIVTLGQARAIDDGVRIDATEGREELRDRFERCR